MVDYRTVCFKEHDRACFSCASESGVEVHHLDGDRNNNEADNLLPLCNRCHKKLHREGLDGFEELLKPVGERSHIDRSKTSFQIQVRKEAWSEWKHTVPREKSLEKRIIELIEADTENRVCEDGNEE